MQKFRKKWLALFLAVLTTAGLFTACAQETPATIPQETTTPPETTAPTPTQSPEEASVLKILTLGHSLTVDSCHMLNMVFAAEGLGEYKEVIIGTLYYSGCALSQHVQFMLADSPDYDLYLSSTATPGNPPTVQKGVTAKEALKRDEWDIIIMHGGAFETTKDVAFTDGRLEAIQNYVNRHKKNPGAVFAWHMPWATPVDNDLRDMYPKEPNTYYSNYEQFHHQRSAFFNAIVSMVEQHIAPNETFRFVIPTATAIENALSSFLEEKDLHRDYSHATDYGRLIAAYTWYCKLMGIEKLEKIKVDAIPIAFFRSTTDKSQDRPVTDMEKAIALEAINNALKEPLKLTQSQYTTAPTE